ncbi:GNAT family N-acetyltransferase [Deinococcus cavernae]|uniref:GNAT family N-acetyltransferase n=1 Tax=Deinococcus cavernae TaxID=2320857 RepID=UPI001F3CA4F3|nr:GNAT family N-acetyltransferase [Deinococcus cavernae]
MDVTRLVPHLAPLLHSLYQATPGYFELLGSRLPNLSEVQADVNTAFADPRRHLELLHDEHGELVGSLDYKVGYPQEGDVTINLLLIREDRQNQRLGEQAVRQLEARLPSGTQRVLASVLGENPRGSRFWERQGYTFELDARPSMMWYAKRLNLPLARPTQLGNIATD